MRITPIDIETRRFPMRFRGFHPEEVSSFLEQIREELEDLLRENAALKERVHKSNDEAKRFWEIQDLLSRTLQDAHQMSEEYRINARREVENLLEKAEETGRDMVGEARERVLHIKEEIAELRMLRKEFDHGMRNILSRFESVVAGESVLQEILPSELTAPVAESGHEVMTAADVDAPSGTEDQISVIEGHQGEEGSSEAQQY